MDTAAPITVDLDALLRGALRSPDGRQVIVENGEGILDDPDALLASAAGPEAGSDLTAADADEGTEAFIAPWGRCCNA